MYEGGEIDRIKLILSLIFMSSEYEERGLFSRKDVTSSL